MRGTVITTRLNADELRRLDELVALRGTSRSEVLRGLIRQGMRTERMQLAEALDLLDGKARSGCLRAIAMVISRLESRHAERPDPRADFGLHGVR